MKLQFKQKKIQIEKEILKKDCTLFFYPFPLSKMFIPKSPKWKVLLDFI